MKNEHKYNFAVLGGDRRQAVIAVELAKRGYKVTCFALGENTFALSGCDMRASLDKAMDGADFVILPLPVSRDNIHLNAVIQNVELGEISKLAAKNNAILLGGSVPSEFTRICSEMGVTIIDYYKVESLQTKNATPSAEGALMIAMEHTDITVQGMNALITGYGRIGKILASILRRLGAKVTVAARRDETLCEISMSGYNAIRTKDIELANAASESDVIFNTIPSMIFNEKVVNRIKNNPLYIEIASSPGGIDAKAAREQGFKIIYAPSLPGKYSPVTAGLYVFETIAEILNDRRIEI